LNRRFSNEKVADLMNQKALSKGEFVRRVISRAPERMRPSGSYVYSILAGKTPNPGSDYLILFAEVLECPLDALLSEYPNSAQEETV